MTHKKILIVDDEPHIRLLLEQTLEELEEAGVEILQAADGVRALELYRETKPDMVFLDVMMPEKSGYEVCESIKGETPSSDTYVVLLTAKGQQADRERAQAAKADRYMTKPFDPAAVVDLVEDVLNL